MENVKTVTTTVTICNGKKTLIRVHPRQPEGVRVPNGADHVHHHDDEEGGDDSSSSSEGEEGEYEYEYEEQEYTETENEEGAGDAVETGTVALPNPPPDYGTVAKDHLRLHFEQVAKNHGGHPKCEHLKVHRVGMLSLGVAGLNSKVITKTVQVHSQ